MSNSPDPIEIGEVLEWHRTNGEVETGVVGRDTDGRPVFVNPDHSGAVIIGEARGYFKRPVPGHSTKQAE